VAEALFEMEAACDGEQGRLRLTGELDIATVPRVQEELDGLIALGVRKLKIDLGRLGFVDSSGLRMFIVLNQRAHAEGWTLELTRPATQALKAFQLTGVEQSLPFVEEASRA
jgi:anti-sigma B factor antagonist